VFSISGFHVYCMSRSLVGVVVFGLAFFVYLCMSSFPFLSFPFFSGNSSPALYISESHSSDRLCQKHNWDVWILPRTIPPIRACAFLIPAKMSSPLFVTRPTPIDIVSHRSFSSCEECKQRFTFSLGACFLTLNDRLQGRLPELAHCFQLIPR
jgi:hypothetical protein